MARHAMTDRSAAENLDAMIRESLKRNDYDLIEAGWKSFRRLFVPRRASSRQLEEMREAYFAGAATLYRLLLAGADDTGDPNEVTEWDQVFIVRVAREINTFGHDLDRKYLKGRRQETH